MALLATAACGDNPAAPTNLARFSQTDLVVGTGADAVSGSSIKVHYTGWLYNDERPDQKGAPFDTSVGRDPLGFLLGQGQVIAGWDQGLVGMKVGGQRRLIIPPSLAYGNARRGPIPPNATLVFDVELIEVQ
ncbi:MAG: FKBP-type peptidyl-prolyl cis-trans isomerase [Vicinamibacterales bacterium]